MRKVNQFNTNGELINSFKSLSEAAKSVGVSKETLSMVCNGKRKSSAGFLWSFKDSVEDKPQKDCKWVFIKGFEGKYQMSDDRKVRRIPFEIEQTDASGKKYTRHFAGGILKQWVDAEGYYAVCLDGDNYRIHWLFYNTFIGDSTGYYIDHKDRNKLNNDPSNLRLLTPKGNNKNKTLAFRPDVQYTPNVYKNKPYMLRFSEDGERKTIGYFKTYEEAENKYRELYEERQKKIDDNSKILIINN